MRETGFIGWSYIDDLKATISHQVDQIIDFRSQLAAHDAEIEKLKACVKAADDLRRCASCDEDNDGDHRCEFFFPDIERRCDSCRSIHEFDAARAEVDL